MEQNTIITAPNDTICAISTPQGVGGIAVIRVSGPEAITITDAVWRGKPLAGAGSHTAHLGHIVDKDGEVVDQAVATLFRAPRSFTTEDVVELAVHGSKLIQADVIKLLIDHGCRMALPGEFTRRAFAGGRMDLAEAEAVADLIAAESRQAHRIAIEQMRGAYSGNINCLRDQMIEIASLLELELDFSEEDVEFVSRQTMMDKAEETLHVIDNLTESFSSGQAIKDGIPVAIIGETNAGKSSLLNTLIGDDRAIVSDIEGTTRDIIEETITVDGLLFRLIDTAGLRETTDPIEKMGIERALERANRARVILWVIDTNTVPTHLPDIASRLPHTGSAPIIALVNKTDLTGQTIPAALHSALSHTSPAPAAIVGISAKTGLGLDQLRKALLKHSGIDTTGQQASLTVTNLRHYEALRNAATALRRFIDGLRQNIPGDLIAQDLRESLHHLGEVTGRVTTPDILQSIFTHFCIGK